MEAGDEVARGILAVSWMKSVCNISKIVLQREGDQSRQVGAQQHKNDAGAWTWKGGIYLLLGWQRQSKEGSSLAGFKIDFQ